MLSYIYFKVDKKDEKYGKKNHELDNRPPPILLISGIWISITFPVIDTRTLLHLCSSYKMMQSPIIFMGRPMLSFATEITACYIPIQKTISTDIPATHRLSLSAQHLLVQVLVLLMYFWLMCRHHGNGALLLIMVACAPNDNSCGKCQNTNDITGILLLTHYFSLNDQQKEKLDLVAEAWFFHAGENYHKSRQRRLIRIYRLSYCSIRLRNAPNH